MRVVRQAPLLVWHVSRMHHQVYVCDTKTIPEATVKHFLRSFQCWLFAHDWFWGDPPPVDGPPLYCKRCGCKPEFLS
jgi:hypothetical protein